MAEEKATELVISLPRLNVPFDGPFDLLLSLIRRNEWSIDDLPILAITGQFLAYVQSAKEFDAELGGEFVEVASWLVLLKSRSLLPVDPSVGQTPRDELRRAVLDHATLTSVTEFLRGRDGEKLHPAAAGAPGGRRQQVLARSSEDGPTVQDVLEAARKALEAASAAASFRDIESVSVTVQDQICWIGEQLAMLPLHTTVSTSPWFVAQPSPGARAALLLAVLELARKGFLVLHQSAQFCTLRVKALREIPHNVQVDAFAYAVADYD